jgi:uncharacterized lipoprotein YajG
MKKILSTIVTVISMTGCAQQTFTVKDNITTASYRYNQTQSFFAYGIGQRYEIDASSICGGRDNVVGIEVQQTFMNSLFSVLTLGIYTPRETTIYCITQSAIP